MGWVPAARCLFRLGVLSGRSDGSPFLVGGFLCGRGVAFSLSFACSAAVKKYAATLERKRRNIPPGVASLRSGAAACSAAGSVPWGARVARVWAFPVVGAGRPLGWFAGRGRGARRPLPSFRLGVGRALGLFGGFLGLFACRGSAFGRCLCSLRSPCGCGCVALLQRRKVVDLLALNGCPLWLGAFYGGVSRPPIEVEEAFRRILIVERTVLKHSTRTQKALNTHWYPVLRPGIRLQAVHPAL